MKRWKKEGIILGVCGLLILLYVCNLRQTSSNRDDTKLREVQELSRKLPLFRDFSEVGSTTRSHYTLVHLTKRYHSKADFVDVKAFYRAILEQEGWIVIRNDHSDHERGSEIAFKKAKFSISVSYTKSSSVYNYAVDFVWDESN